MIHLDIDLTLEEVGAAGAPGLTASVKADGSEIVVHIDDPSRLPGRRDLRSLTELADGLARRGVSVRVEGPDGTIVAFGDVHASALQRMMTGSPHIRLGSVQAIAPLLRRRDDAFEAFAPPPPTLFPLFPTVQRGVRRKITTTHYVPGSGRPRLIFAVGTGAWDSTRPREFDLLPGVTRIGSGPDADLQLPGLSGVHAIIEHTADDEYVLVPFDRTLGGRAVEPGGPAEDVRVLRTGARIELGPWRMAYYREEFADHGRPFGGRQGGEYAIQKPQPPKPYPPKRG
jgi:hypothetical protein